MDNLFEILLTSEFLFSVIRVTTPILFAALGGLIANKAGVPNIGLEGIMLMSALFGVIGSAYSQSALIGLFTGIFVGWLMGAILGYFTLKLKTHVILGGIAINLFASGASIFILYLLTGEKGTSSSLPSLTLPAVNVPFIENIPYIGAALSGHNILTYISILLVVYVWYMLKYTKLGLRIRAVGENEDAAESVGINVKKIQFIAISLSGIFAGLGGVFLSMGYVSWFSRDMSAGRGWIALAAEAMGRGSVLGTTLSSLLFGAADALGNTLQLFSVPAELISIIPYVATVVSLLIFAIRDTNKRKKENV